MKFIHSASDYGMARFLLYGITKDPETSNYIVVLRYMADGSLRSKLMINKYNYKSLLCIARPLSALHKCNLVHGDFHSGNLLLDGQDIHITDLGLSKPADKPSQTNEIYGILPYIAPEVLRGNPYTKLQIYILLVL